MFISRSNEARRGPAKTHALMISRVEARRQHQASLILMAALAAALLGGILVNIVTTLAT
jgi:hypothetical protein